MPSTNTSRLCLVILIISSFSAIGYSQDYSNKIRIADPNHKPPPAKIDQMSWVSGDWEGEALGGQVEESWSAPSAGTMMCSFRSIKDNQVQFYEFVVLKEESESLVIKIKHFSRDLVGWEEKDKTVDFRLISLEENLAYFDGFTFERIDENHMNIYVLFDQKEDKLVVGKFAYTRK